MSSPFSGERSVSFMIGAKQYVLFVDPSQIENGTVPVYVVDESKDEVIADLPVENGRNTGAVGLVRELARVLTPGSAAVLTEFGGDFDPGPLDLGEHVEWSIDFRQLRAAAGDCGLTATEIPLHELLKADLSVRCASYTDLWRLRRLARCDVFAAPADQVRRRFPLLSRLLALELPEIGSPRWPDATAPAGFAQLFRALILRK